MIVTDTDGAWRMAYVIWVDGGARNPKVPTLFQIAEMVLGSSTGSTPTWLPTSAQGSERSGPEAYSALLLRPRSVSSLGLGFLQLADDEIPVFRSQVMKSLFD